MHANKNSYQCMHLISFCCNYMYRHRDTILFGKVLIKVFTILLNVKLYVLKMYSQYFDKYFAYARNSSQGWMADNTNLHPR